MAARLQAPNGVLAFDFDGTLAKWLPGANQQYLDARQAVMDVGAVLGPVAWLKSLRRQGYEIAIVTGRDRSHLRWIRQWCRIILGSPVAVYCRPDHVELACKSQALWKSSVLRRINARAYVGDNPRIDEIAARIAGIQYIPVESLLNGAFPTFTGAGDVVNTPDEAG